VIFEVIGQMSNQFYFYGTSGHRIPKSREHILDAAKKAILYIKNKKIRGIDMHILMDLPCALICGAALEEEGWDRVIMDEAIAQDVPLALSLPFVTRMYHYNLKKYVEYAQKTTGLIKFPQVKQGSNWVNVIQYQPDCYRDRNQIIVDNSKRLLIYWDGRLSGGTFMTRNMMIKKHSEHKIKNYYI
jgi:hypothetical protein